jgi:hypothetical protein
VDLAPSKQRVTAVRNWLEEATTGIPAGLAKDVFFSDAARDRTRKYRVSPLGPMVARWRLSQGSYLMEKGSHRGY